MMLGLILPLKMDARMYPSQITVPAVCFSDPRELYIYQEMILGETLVAAAKTLATVKVEDQGWIVIFYNKEKDTWSLAGHRHNAPNAVRPAQQNTIAPGPESRNDLQSQTRPDLPTLGKFPRRDHGYEEYSSRQVPSEENEHECPVG